MNGTDEINEYAANTIAAVKRNEAYFAKLATSFEKTGVSVICNSLNGAIKTWNDACVEMFGYAAREVIEKNISLIIPPKFIDNEKTIFNKVVEGKTVVKYESVKIKKNLVSFQVEVTASPLCNKAGEIVGVCKIIRDITIEKQLKKTLNSANMIISLQQTEKEKMAAELEVANMELVFQNKEKKNRAAELLIANKELFYQNKEKEQRAAELLIANLELVYQNEEKQKRAEELSIANEELVFLNRQQQAFFAAIVNSSDDAMLSKTLDGVITSWNHGAEKIFGYSADEIIGKNVLTLIPPALQQEDAEITKRIQHGETLDHYETKRLRKNGDIFYASLSISPIRNFEGNIIGASKVLCDITEQKKGDEERKGLAERLQLATKSAKMGIWDWDLENNILVWDEEMYKLYGIVANEFTSLYEESFLRLHEEDRERVANEMQLAIANKKDFDTEFRIVRNDSSIHFIKATGIVERDTDGKAQRMIGVNLDITQSKKAAAEIKSFNERLESKIIERTQQLETVNKELEAFSYSVSHDLRAPLRAVNSYAQIMIEEYGQNLDEDGLTLLENIRYNGEKMGRLIDELLSFSKLSSKKPQLETVNLDQLIKKVMTDLGEHYSIHAAIKINPLPLVQADNTMLYQVFYNLLSNAVKYSSKKEHPVIEVFTEEKNNKAVFVVKDNGAGFDMQYADKLFGVFQRLHSEKQFEGNGVGLAIVQRIVTKFGGKVWAEAKENEGATFYFTLN